MQNKKKCPRPAMANRHFKNAVNQFYHMAKKKSSGSDRTRNWAFIVYPESAPENWRDVIDEEHIKWAESPLHDMDVNPTGEVKKEHWHILVVYDSVKSFEQVKELTDKLNAPIPQKCASPKGLIRYMAHLDNPEKTQYSILDIKAHGGMDLDELMQPSFAQRQAMLAEMIKFIADNNITSYIEFAEYAMKHRYEDWFYSLCKDSTYMISTAIKSVRYKQMSRELAEERAKD